MKCVCVRTSPGSEDHVSEVDEVTEKVYEEPVVHVVGLQLLETRPETHTHTHLLFTPTADKPTE